MHPCWRLLFLACFILTVHNAVGQSARTENLLQWAAYERMNRGEDRAHHILQRAVRNAPADPRPYAVSGGWYTGAGRFREAAAVYYQGFNKAAGGDTLFAKPLAEALLRSGQAGSAGSVLSSVPQKRRDAAWTRLSAQARFAAPALLSHAGDTAAGSMPVPLGPRVNTTDAETFPIAKADGSLLLFTRRVAGMDEEFFRAVPDSCGGWFTARALPSPPNTPMMEHAQSLSACGHYLFFTRCEQRSETGWGGGGCDLYMAYTADGNRADSIVWSNPEPFGGTINSPDYEGAPALSPDNRELFFASGRPGGFGGLDLYSARFQDGLWQVPRNLGSAVNGPGDETAPFLAADGTTLYFSSSSPVDNFGGRDLYRTARRDGTDTVWTAAQNLGPAINSGGDEASISIHPDGNTALFSSDRGKRAGDFDLYSIRLPQAVAPQPATFVRGAAFDSISRERLTYTRIVLSDASTGEKLYDVLSNRGDGSYTLVLQPRVRYAVWADRIGYREAVDTLYFDSSMTTTPAVWNVALLPGDYEPPVLAGENGDATTSTMSADAQEETPLLRIHFDKNVVAVTEREWDAISNAVDQYADSTDAVIVINSYTDDSGAPLTNEQLSELRAKLVADVVARAGIPANRIEARGWADAAPIAPNDTDENRKLNRRVEIMVRTLPTSASTSLSQ